MPTEKHKQVKIKFDHNWRCRPTDDINTNVMINTNSYDDPNWISLQLPHIIVKKELETNHTSTNNEQNWWYHKEFEWKVHRQNSDQHVYLIFESHNDHYTNENNNDYSSLDIITVWLNKIQIYSDSFQSPKISIDLTEQLVYKDDSNENNPKNTLIVCCTNASLSLHTYLLLPHDIAHVMEEENIDINTDRNCSILPFRKNRVLDYLVGFDIDFNPKLKSLTPSKHPNSPNTTEQENTDSTIDRNGSTFHLGKNSSLDYLIRFNDGDGRFDIDCNPKLESPTPSKYQNSPDIIVSEDYDKKNEQIINNKKNIEEFSVPRLAIVILIVGSRGDVQPFVAFGQTLRAAGHRVRLATHEKFRKYICEHGLEFYPLASNPDDLMSFVVKNGGVVPSMSSIIAGDLKKKRRDISNILVSTWLACTENDEETSAPFTAEVIIANPPSFGHVHCAQKLQIPLHMMFTMPWSATTVFPHAFCKVDHSKIQKEKLNLLSYSVMDVLTWSGMHDLVNDFRRDTLDLPPLHTRQAIHTLFYERVPHTYCWSPSLVPRPHDWPSHIDVSGYFFLNTDTDRFKPPDDLVTFLGLDNDNQNEEKLTPPMYIGFGSITGNDSRRLLQVVLGALERTGYRALISGFDKDHDELPDNIFKIGDVPHDWLFQHVSAVCHHGGAGTTAAGLRAGKPTIIIPFFGDQFFWGNVVAKNGVGPLPLPGKNITIDELVQAFEEVHESEMISAAARIREVLSHEDGCTTALHMFHAQLPLSRMRSDLESTFAACYRVDEFDLQVSRPVAQVLVAAGALDESQFRSHSTREWTSIYDDRAHVPTSGAFKHTQKAFSYIFINTTGGMRRAVTSTNLLVGVANGVGGACKDIGKGVGHLSVAVVSLYGELTDVFDRVPSLYDQYSEPNAHERPHVTDFKSGAKAAGLSIKNGWKDGITGLVRTPRVGYRRRGILGGASGVLVATANSVVKPTVGSLASVTWLGRGTYANMTKKKQKNRSKKQQIIINKLSVQSSFSLSSSPSDTGEQEQDDENDDDDDDDDNVPTNIKFAAVISGYPAKVCQEILDEFAKVKKHQEQIASLSPNQTQEHRHRHLFRRHRRHSDSAL